MSNSKEKIAIVGMSCRFPGEATSPEAYWDILKNGKDLVTEVSPDRWGTDFYKHPDKKEPGKSYTFAAGVLNQVDEFDAAFFGISPREAAQMDPQQRLLLELTWEALEDGNQIPESLAGSQCAVYVGIASTDYAHRRMDDLSSLDPYSMTGNTASIASNRISYIFDLHGPSVSVDTACSSSLVALHQACNAIWNGDAPSAIAGGVNMLLHPFGFVGFSKASMLSPSGRCKAFDASGDGYVRSEGSAVLYLKPLVDAERDGDPIHAVIIDTAINSDGKTNGITLPSTDGQASLLDKIYKRAGIKPDDLSYVEAHGTGTVVGDPLEAGALANVLGKPRKKPLPIGSAKTNLGHLETASGMAGLLKIILSLKNKAIPASLHFNQPNPNIDFEADQLSVVTSYTELSESDKPHVMGVNSFGFGGANAHAIVEEYVSKSVTLESSKKSINKPSIKKAQKSSAKNIEKISSPLFLSANSDAALREMAGQYRDLLQQKNISFEELAYSIYENRQKFKHGLAIHGDELHDVIECLHSYSQGEIHTGTVVGSKVELINRNSKAILNSPSVQNPKLALVFSGNGSQWQGMGCELLINEPLFLETILEIDKLLSIYQNISLVDEFNATTENSKLHLTEVAQPLLFALQVGVIRVLKAKGLIADAVVGHSVGEVAAAWCSGILSLEQAVKVIFHRSHAQAKTVGAGRMAAAAMSQEDVILLVNDLGLTDEITIAGVNSPKSVTLSGSLVALKSLEESFEDKGTFFRILDLDYAFHSVAMDPVEDEIKANLSDMELEKSSIAFYSTVTGNKTSSDKLTGKYWWENIRQPVLFSEAMDNMLDDGYQVFLEIGPHPVLRSYVNECSREKELEISSISTIKRQAESKTALLNALYSCYLSGCKLDVTKVFSFSSSKQNTSIQLPHYPWQREKHWYNLTAEGSDLVNRDREHPLLGYRLKNYEASWENQIDTALFEYLADHVVDGGVVMPAAAYVEMALAASLAWFDDSVKDKQQWEIENLEIRAPIVLDNSKTLRFKLIPEDGSFVISSRDRLSDGLWSENVVGRLLGETNRNQPDNVVINSSIKRSEKHITSVGHYKLTEAVGLSYGPTFQGVAEVWVSSLNALAKLNSAVSLGIDTKNYQLHPVLLDAGFQVLVDIFSEKIGQGSQAALIPVQIGKLYHYQTIEDLAYLSVSIVKQSPQSVVANYLFLNSGGEVLVELKNCRFRGVQLMRSKASFPATYQFKPLLMPYLDQGVQSPMPKPALLVSHAVDFLNNHKKELQRDRHYKEVLPLFDLMVSMFAWQAIHALNPKGDEFTLESLAEQAHIESVKFPLLSRLLSILVEDDLATYENNQWLLSPSSDLPSAEDIWLSVLGDSPDYLPELMLLGRCGKHLADVLQNKIQSEDLLYSEKSSIQEHWSGASPSNLSMNLALRNMLSEITLDWPANKRFRILEVGGNDTEISQQILPVLPKDQCDYVYIHHDESHLLKAGFNLENWDFVNVHELDLSQELTAENSPVELASFDIVIIANTLYRSNDCAKSQKNIKKLLSSKGILLMLERESDRFMDMTFGLENDWWAHSSEESGSIPLLMTASAWRTELKETGFEQVELLVEPEATGDIGAFMAVAQNLNYKLIEKEPESTLEDIQTWMILKDGSDDSSQLAQEMISELSKMGHKIVTVEAGESYKRLGQLHFLININADNSEEEGFSHIITTLNKIDVHCDQIVHLMGLRWHSNNQTDNNDLNLQRLRCSSTIDLVKSISTLDIEKLPSLKLITSGGATISDDGLFFSYEPNPSQAALWGLGRVIMNEHPDIDCHMIDLQGAFDADAISHLLTQEFLKKPQNKTTETEVILSKNTRHVLRMMPSNIETSNNERKFPKKKDYALKFNTPGQLKNLVWEELGDSFCQADEIEIKPYAAGLNFRDVMYAMGLLSDEAVENGFAGPTLGMEVSGIVTDIGSAVNDFKKGDHVVGFAPACFSSRVITQTTAITKKPEGWGFEEATTIPTTFFTVYYALKHLAQIEPGEKILIHGAAGGVGIAAIQYARYCGAEIFATAGSDEKRDFVRLLGADHVMDSRSLAFADDIMQITNGEGVDIVLNSLAGEAITRNLAVLKPFGRFLELGKRDFYENSKIGLRPFRNNISYFGIDADQLLIERPALANRLFKEMMSLFDNGSLRPMPFRSFPATRIQDAFRYMQQSRQIGKVVVSFENGNAIPQNQIQALPVKGPELLCDSSGAYLITGGLTGFGLRTACWLADKGAKSLVLISRSANIDEESKLTIESLKTKGIEVFVRACDVTDKGSLLNLVTEIQRDVAPLKGLVHAAMVLDDGLIRNMTQEQLLKVMQPKVTGAWNLHEVTIDLNLDFFVLYSSATTFVGNPGQANYVAANSYMESLVNYRRSKGLKACFAAWGAISDVGYLARNEETKEALQSRLGGEALSSNNALKMLEKIILSDNAGAAVIDLDWGVIQRVMPSASSAKYEELQKNVKNSDGDHEDIQILIANLGSKDIQDLVIDLLLDEIEQILRLPREKLDVERSIFDLGMDSLMGMELVLAIEERFGVKLPVMALTEGANIIRIAERITEQLSNDDSESNDSTGSDKVKTKHEEDISVAASRHGHAANMTEAEAEALSKKLIEDAMKH